MNGRGMVSESIQRLAQYWQKLNRMYGGTPKLLAWASMNAEKLDHLGPPEESTGQLIKKALDAVDEKEE